MSTSAAGIEQLNENKNKQEHPIAYKLAKEKEWLFALVVCINQMLASSQMWTSESDADVTNRKNLKSVINAIFENG